MSAALIKPDTLRAAAGCKRPEIGYGAYVLVERYRRITEVARKKADVREGEDFISYTASSIEKAGEIVDLIGQIGPDGQVSEDTADGLIDALDDLSSFCDVLEAEAKPSANEKKAFLPQSKKRLARLEIEPALLAKAVSDYDSSLFELFEAEDEAAGKGGRGSTNRVDNSGTINGGIGASVRGDHVNMGTTSTVNNTGPQTNHDNSRRLNANGGNIVADNQIGSIGGAFNVGNATHHN